MRHDFMESVHPAMAQLNFIPEIIEDQVCRDQLEDMTIREESVTITCRCFIHVKRQARNIWKQHLVPQTNSTPEDTHMIVEASSDLLPHHQ